MQNPSLQRMLENAKEAYEKRGAKKFSCILGGDIGVGKTTMLLTARKPLWIDSFDPGGMTSIRDHIDMKNVFVDTRYEAEDPRNPSAFALWEKEYQTKKASGFFNKLGTYCIDSATTWADAIMNSILRQKGRPGSFPQMDDYGPQMAAMAAAWKDMMSLPCNVVLTAHPEMTKDEKTGRVFISFMLTGKLKTRFPLLCDEIYFLLSKETADGVHRSVLTQNDGLWRARSRLGANGRFAKFEEPNFKLLLKKAGFPTEDLPPIEW